jgi:ubiquinone/menaquinone biosynthesis C-methylase UbiE
MSKSARMKEAEANQHKYYAATAHMYDDMHARPADEHYVALKYISTYIDLMAISSILDVGSGTGRGVKYVLEHHPSVKVSGIEPVQALIDQAVDRNHIPAQLITRARAESLPFTDHSFDAVCELGVLHHVRNPNQVVKEMIRVARKAVFLSDGNRFGHGTVLSRLTKLSLWSLKLWPVANFVNTRGRGYTLSEGDGLFYSYSVFDSFRPLAEWADRLLLIPTGNEKPGSLMHPLITSQHVLLCALKGPNAS